MFRQLRFVASLTVLAALIAFARPLQVKADTDVVTKGLIIGAAVSGGIVLIAIVGTALTRDDPRWLTPGINGELGGPLPAAGPVKYGLQCPKNMLEGLTICW